MKLEELRKLEKGTILELSLGNDWYRGCKFIKLVQAYDLGKSYAGKSNDFNVNKARKKWLVKIEYKTDFRNTVIDYVDPRRLNY